MGVRRLGRSIAGFALVTLAACSSENLPSDLRFQSAHFEYYARATDEAICPDLAGPLEDHFATLQSYFGFDWPAGRKVKYYKFTDMADFTANNQHCPLGSGGCTDQDSVVQSVNGLDTHELVHAYLFPTGDPPNVLVEGVAVALSCTSLVYPQRPTETWDQLANDMFSAKDTVTVYQDGAWLVGYLLDTFGPQPFMTLYATLKSSADASAMDAAFQAVYGQSLADIWAAALADNQPRNVCIWQCSRPPIVLDGSAFDTTGVCGTDSQRPFTLAAESVVSFATTGADLKLGPCGQITPPTDGLNGTFPYGGVTALYDLPAGTYYLDHSPLPGTITAGLDPAALSPTCTSATDLTALSSAAMLYVAVPSSQPLWFLPLRPPQADGSQPGFLPLLDFDGYAEVCDGCDQASCTNTNETLPPWASGQVVRFTSVTTDPYSTFMLFWE